MANLVRGTRRAICLLILGLILFLSLFMTLAYPEIIRHGWPLTSCNILSSDLHTRYCCETSCDTSGCSSAPSGAALCNPLITQIDNGYSPSACAANNTACPPYVGSTCNGGDYCCSQCCSTCTSCSTTCSKDGCSTSCSSYSCNCTCCSSTSQLSCVLKCPTCYSVILSLSYMTRGRNAQQETTNFTQEFKKNQQAAEKWYVEHKQGANIRCHYNPKKLTEVSLDVSFTPYKWAIVSIFGIVPLFFSLGFLLTAYALIPLYRVANRGLTKGKEEEKGQDYSAVMTSDGLAEASPDSADEKRGEKVDSIDTRPLPRSITM
ncbi:hypothetical protein CPB83DRAFT_822365 [Crepidotus variabilis]|uniref:TNFR-Cys domain-containing protein n=1 Tax=Crepidotus variabilis TaxID=179855 RepID=A0A9P6E5E9_9AGAR|nr:hypothetical protein CPB83DRAFT_822365 [Crepidotus variabilis]